MTLSIEQVKARAEATRLVGCDVTMAEDSRTIPEEIYRQAMSRLIRVKKEDSAFVYFILESHEGIVSYSTLDFKPGDAYRDLELVYPVSFQTEVDELLGRLGEMIYELSSPERAEKLRSDRN